MSVSSSLEIFISSAEEDVRYDVCEATHDKVMISSSKRLREERRPLIQYDFTTRHETYVNSTEGFDMTTSH